MGWAHLIWVVALITMVGYSAWVVRDNRKRMARIDEMRQSLADEHEAIAETLLVSSDLRSAVRRDTEPGA